MFQNITEASINKYVVGSQTIQYSLLIIVDYNLCYFSIIYFFGPLDTAPWQT